MTLALKQSELTTRMNHYLLSNPQVWGKIPPESVIIPVDAIDRDYFRHSMKLLEEAVKEKKQVMMGVVTNDTWVFGHFA